MPTLGSLLTSLQVIFLINHLGVRVQPTEGAAMPRHIVQECTKSNFADNDYQVCKLYSSITSASVLSKYYQNPVNTLSLCPSFPHSKPQLSVETNNSLPNLLFVMVSYQRNRKQTRKKQSFILFYRQDIVSHKEIFIVSTGSCSQYILSLQTKSPLI